MTFMSFFTYIENIYLLETFRFSLLGSHRNKIFYWVKYIILHYLDLLLFGLQKILESLIF